MPVNDLVPAAHDRPSRTVSGAQSGFSVIEATIASAILLIVAVGLLPMFTLSISNNKQGRDSMEITNEARSELERLLNLSFDDPELTVPTGETVLTVEAFYDGDEWIAEAEYDGSGFTYHRIVEIRQFDASAIDDGLLDPDEAVSGGAALDVNFKEILVQMESAGSIGAPRKEVTLRGIRAV